MAIPNNLILNPSTGNGDTTITVTQNSPYTGRLVRTNTITGGIIGYSNTVSIIIEEEAKPVFLTPDAITYNVTANGGNIHITGKSNAIKIYNGRKTGTDFIDTPPTTYIINGNQTETNNVNISNDIGATEEFTFDIKYEILENTTTTSRSGIVEISSGSLAVQITIIQDASDAYLYLNDIETTSISITIPQDGTTQTFNVLSNTSWSFED